MPGTDPDAVSEVDDRIFYFPFFGNQFVGITYPVNIPDTRQIADTPDVKFRLTDTDQVMTVLGAYFVGFVFDPVQLTGQRFFLFLTDVGC